MDANYVYGYLFISLIVGGALTKTGSFVDLVASAIVGLLWPVVVPIRLLKKLL